MGKVAIEGMEFYAYHGYYKNERKIGGTYLVDVYMDTNFMKAAKNDKLKGTINYEVVFDICKEVMDKPSKLIEHLAYQILTEVMRSLSPVKQARVRISKIRPPLKGQVVRTFVELHSDEL